MIGELLVGLFFVLLCSCFFFFLRVLIIHQFKNSAFFVTLLLSQLFV